VLANWSEQAELVPLSFSEFTSGDELGQSVAIDGDTAVVGAPGDDSDAGAVYVFERTGTTWAATQRLVAPDGVGDDRFGFSVAISDDTIIVGAPDANANLGSVYAFSFHSMSSSYEFDVEFGPTPTAGDLEIHFGQSVALDDGVLVVGAPFDDFDDDGTIISDAGSIQLFVRSAADSWSDGPKHYAAGARAADEFGRVVAISDDRIVAGAPGFDVTTPSLINAVGAAYAMTRSGTSIATEQRLMASDFVSNDQFGSSVAIDGTTIVVGSPLADQPSLSSTGAAYAFVEGVGGWSQQAKLTHSALVGGDTAGRSVAIEGDLVAVGATGYDITLNDQNGGVFVYRRSGSTWTLEDTAVIESDLGGGGNQLGISVAIDGGAIVAGARNHAHSGIGLLSGAAYVFVDPNDAPVNSVPGPQTIDEGDALTFAAANSNAISISDVDAFGAAVRVTLAATNGTLTLGGTSGLTFGAGDGMDDATMTFDGTIADINAALDDTVFTPTDADYFGPASVSITTNDLGNTGTGGPQIDTDAIGITVDAVNDAPTLATAANHTSNEDDGPQSVAGFATASAGPANEAGQTLTYNVTMNTNPALFLVPPTIAPDGTLSYTAAADANGSATITVEVMDDGGTANGGADTSAPAMFTITVDPVNDAPTANSQVVNVTEDGQATIVLGGSDVETAEADLTFTITSLPASGVLTLGGAPVQVGDTFVGPPSLLYEPAAGSGATGDSFTFTVTDRGDPDNAPGDPAETSAAATVTINVNAAVPGGAAVLTDGILRVGGGGANDTVLVDRINATTLRVSINGANTDFPLADVTEIRIWGRDGNDTITINSNVSVNATIDAGGGNDMVSGGSGHDLIFGGDGGDLIFGNGGNDMVLGGAGTDLVFGGAGHDVLVAGSLEPQFTTAMLRDVAQAWAADRIAAQGTDDGTIDESAVDNEFDILAGGSGADWYIIDVGLVIGYWPFGSNGDVITSG
jgi:Ca2+-binding RTX toxin-like protein